MPGITIYQGASGEGQELAETVAQALGYCCVGREVLVEASQRYLIPEAKLNAVFEKGPTGGASIARSAALSDCASSIAMRAGSRRQGCLPRPLGS
jgi:hypothetical protein